MFTGLITDVGRVRAVTSVGDRRIEIETSFPIAEIGRASIACSGVLTAIEFGDNWFAVEASEDNVETTVGDWQAGDALNLERSLQIGDEQADTLCSDMWTVLRKSPNAGRMETVFDSVFWRPAIWRLISLRRAVSR